MDLDLERIEKRAQELAKDFRNEGSTVAQMLPLARHAAQVEIMQEDADQLARYDQLTGLLRPWAILRHLSRELKIRERSGSTVGILAIDLDHFKLVNDTHGHAMGDAVLRRTGEIIRQHLREEDAGGRPGGEEMLVVTEGSDYPEVLANRVRKDLASHYFGAAGGPSFQVTMSVGVAVARNRLNISEYPDADQLLIRADRALYQAKAAGRNRVVLG